MRIACPSCAAEYDVPASLLTPHKSVRCARCGGEWEPELAAEEVEPDPAATEAPPDHLAPDHLALVDRAAETEPAVRSGATAMERLAAAPATPRSRAGLGGAWILTVVVLVGAVVATVVWREQVMRIWPPSGRILAPFGHMMPQPGQTESIKAK